MYLCTYACTNNVYVHIYVNVCMYIYLYIFGMYVEKNIKEYQISQQFVTAQWKTLSATI